MALKAGTYNLQTDLFFVYSSYLLFIKADITAISKRLGHDNLQTTINTYSHLYKDANEQLMKKLNNS